MDTAANRVMDAGDWGRLLALAFLWGFSFLFIALALRQLPPLTVALGRVGIAAVVLVVFAALAGHALPRQPRVLGQFVVMGILNNALPFALIMSAQTRIASGLAAILNASTPLFAMVLAHLLTRDERLTAMRLAGVVVGIAGVAATVGVDALAGFGHAVEAELAVVAAALCYGLAGLYGRRFRALPPAVTAAGQLCGATAVMLPVVLLVDRPWDLAMPGPATWGALVALAVFATALAYVLYFRILATSGAVNLLLVTLLIPAVAVLAGAFVLGERLALHSFAGLLLIALGLAVIDGRIFGRRRRRIASG